MHTSVLLLTPNVRVTSLLSWLWFRFTPTFYVFVTFLATFFKIPMRTCTSTSYANVRRHQPSNNVLRGMHFSGERAVRYVYFTSASRKRFTSLRHVVCAHTTSDAIGQTFFGRLCNMSRSCDDRISLT